MPNVNLLVLVLKSCDRSEHEYEFFHLHRFAQPSIKHSFPIYTVLYCWVHQNQGLWQIEQTLSMQDPHMFGGFHTIHDGHVQIHDHQVEGTAYVVVLQNLF